MIGALRRSTRRASSTFLPVRVTAGSDSEKKDLKPTVAAGPGPHWWTRIGCSGRWEGLITPPILLFFLAQPTGERIQAEWRLEPSKSPHRGDDWARHRQPWKFCEGLGEPLSIASRVLSSDYIFLWSSTALDSSPDRWRLFCVRELEG